MLTTHSITYRWLNMADAQAATNKFVIDSVDRSLAMRTAVFDRENWHGGFAGPTVASGRLFTFSGRVFGATRAERSTGQSNLLSALLPETYPSDSNKGFYELRFETDSGLSVKTQAKVWSMPKFDPDSNGVTIGFTFELYAEEAVLKWSTDKTAAGVDGWFGGTTLGITLPVAMDEVGNPISVSNAWNFVSKARFEISGGMTDPKVMNVTNGRFFALEGITTTALVIDWTWSTLTVTDGWTNVKAYRATGSEPVLLEPGSNSIVVYGVPADPDDSVTVTVSWNDGWMLT